MAIRRVTVNKISIEDRPGALHEVLSAAAKGGSNVLHLAALAVGEGKGQAYLISDKPGALDEFAKSRGLPLENFAGFLLDGANRVGLGADVTKPIADAGINVVLSTATVIGSDYYLLIVVDENDADSLLEALGE